MWQITDPDAEVIKKIKDGTVTQAELDQATKLGLATQLGLAPGDLVLAGCAITGNECTNVFAVSIPGVTPAAYITWFQAAAAARNAGKRLPTNAEWQAAALGTPDDGNCNIGSSPVIPTNSMGGCVSDVGAFDMVGNLWEWVADWVPRSSGCGGSWSPFSDDLQCLAGAETTGKPGAVVRGGSFGFGAGAGVFAVVGGATPAQEFNNFGFRAAR